MKRIGMLLILGLILPAGAQEVLTLEQAVKTALIKNPNLAAARWEVQKADARVHEAVGNALPALNLSSRYTHAIQKPIFFVPGSFVGDSTGKTIALRVGANYSMDVTLTVQQILFNGAVFVGMGAAKIYSGAAREMFRSTQLETVTRVRKAYYGILLAAEARSMMRRTLKNSEENLRNAQLLAAQGILSEYDQLRATVGVENLRPQVIQAENNYELALDGLRAAMGMESNFQFLVNDSLKYEPVDESLLESAIDLVGKSNTTLKALGLQVDVNKAFVWGQRSNYLPTVAAFGNYQYQLAHNDTKFSTRDFYGSSMVGLSLSMNLFEGLQTNARVQQAKVEVRKSEEQLAGMKTNLRILAHSLVLQLRQTRQRIEAQARTVEQAERGYRIASSRFANGLGTQLEVNDAQLAFNQAQVNRIQAIYDYQVASADLEQVLGRFPKYVADLKE